jgi:16S rRNA (guanine527-N7)-methyltransferase
MGSPSHCPLAWGCFTVKHSGEEPVSKGTVPDPWELYLPELPTVVAPRQAEQLAALLQVLEADEHAPSAVRDAERAAEVHLADSLIALGIGALRGADRIADLGSGAGFPGLALAVALPDAEVRLVESQKRKCEYLERACGQAGVVNVSVVCARAEEWREGMEENDVVVARALAAQPVVMEYAAPLLRVGGTLIDWRGGRDEQEEREARCASEELGLRLVEIRYVEPYRGSRDRHLHVFEKLARTPPRFPRRAGIARKRPLGR